jgi:hypothetical protein
MTMLAGRASGMTLSLLAVLGAGAATPAAPAPTADDSWSEANAILARVVAPTFPDRSFPITKFGAAGNGKTDARPAIPKAIKACVAAAGGHVVSWTSASRGHRGGACGSRVRGVSVPVAVRRHH